MLKLVVIYFITILLSFVLANNGKLFLQRILPPCHRCWQICAEDGALSKFLIKSLSKLYNPIYVGSLKQIEPENLQYCDGYMFIFQSVDEMVNGMRSKNIRRIRNKKMIVFYISNEEYIMHDSIIDDVHEKTINLILVKIFLSNFELFPNFTVYEDKSLEFEIYAPLVNKKLVLNNFNYTQVINPIGHLFELQKWRPNFIRYNKTFHISLFHCPPFVIRDKNGGLSGIEYNIVSEIVKGWKVKIHNKEILEAKEDPWSAVKDDIAENVTDLATCSMWLILENWLTVDMSKEYGNLCSTFLVPKPTPIDTSKYIYLPLSRNVWIFYTFSLIVVSVFMYFLARVGSKTVPRRWQKTRYKSLSRCVAEAVAAVSSHGAVIFPPQESLRHIMVTWMVVCVIISASYSTGVASLLTTPRFSRNIETFKDMVDEGVYWGHSYNNQKFGEDLRQTTNIHKKIFLKREKPEHGIKDRFERIARNNYAIFVKVLGNNYVTDTAEFKDVAYKLKLIKECVSENYIVFGLQKNSPYTSIFNDKIIQMAEGGLINYWISNANRLNEFGINYMNHFFESYKHIIRQPSAIQYKDVCSHFYFLLIGLIISSIVFIFEITFYCYLRLI